MTDSAGDFTFQLQGNTYLKTDDSIDNYANFVGAATSFGTVMGTLKVSNPQSGPIPTSGPCTWTSQAFLDDGTTVTAHGEGSYEQLASEQKWNIDLKIQISNGANLRSVGEIDLAKQTFSGKFSEA
jgi:hypothetical protein